MAHHDTFTGREKDVAALLMQGKSNAQIALELSIATRTVEFHISHIYAKLGVASRAEAILRLSGDLREPAGAGESASLRESAVENGEQRGHNGEKSIPPARTPMKTPFYLAGASLLIVALIAIILLLQGRAPDRAPGSTPTPFPTQAEASPAPVTPPTEEQSLTTAPPATASSQVGASTVDFSLEWFYIDESRVYLQGEISGFPLTQGQAPVSLVDVSSIRLHLAGGDPILFGPSGDPFGGSGGEAQATPVAPASYEVTLDAPLTDPPAGLSAGAPITVDIPVGGQVYDANGQLLDLPRTSFHFETRSFYPGSLTFTSEKSAVIEDKTVTFRLLELNPGRSHLVVCVRDPEGQQWVPTVHLLYKGDVYDFDHGWSLTGPVEDPRNEELCYRMPYAFPFDPSDDPRSSIAIWVEKITKDQPDILPYELIATAQNKLSAQGIEFEYAIASHGARITITRKPEGLSEMDAQVQVQKALNEEAATSGIVLFDLN